MFGLFKKPISNNELFDLIFILLVDMRTSFKSNDSHFDSAIKDLPKWVDLKCDAEKKKMTSDQQAYVRLARVSGGAKAEKIRSIIDQMLAILDIPDPTQTQIACLHTLRAEFDSIFWHVAMHCLGDLAVLTGRRLE